MPSTPNLSIGDQIKDKLGIWSWATGAEGYKPRTNPRVWPDWAIYGFLGNFSKPVGTIILAKLPILFGAIFVKVSKSLIFLVKSFSGNFYRHLATFYCHTGNPLTYGGMCNDHWIQLWSWTLPRIAFTCGELCRWGVHSMVKVIRFRHEQLGVSPLRPQRFASSCLVLI